MPRTFIEILLERLAQDTPRPPPELMDAYALRAQESEPNLQEIISRHLGDALAALPKPEEIDTFEDA